ncbi:rhomboid-like protein [Streptomyces buecherae]|uniref:rhomboid-like protein n=1 Tax=Streptomyces buecherae TaxID=2763006 RepID=UPI0027E3031B|nr:rhomboid-like protein [Streptomyces buecherae]
MFAWRGRRGWGARLAPALPTPARTPFTFCYAVVLLATGLFILWGDPGAVHGALEGSSSDASNLAHRPLFALVTSGIWVAGGLTSPSIALFPFVLGALERRVGAWCTAAVFALGHVLATLFTELPVAAAVASGHLPPSSLDRLDYGISYGLLASLAALAGLLVRKVRWAVLVSLGAVLALDLIELADPLTNWGHVLAVLIGLACWSPLRSRSTRHPEQR